MGIERVIGIDFSAADDAGRRAWITEGSIEGGRLRVTACYPAEKLPGSGRALAQAMAALRELIRAAGPTLIGLDFPFSLPECLVRPPSWSAFVESFAERFPDVELFREWCREPANHACPTIIDRPECKRRTDIEKQTPFCPYNLRLYRQTYYGIRDLLAPLVAEGAVSVLPMQAPAPGRPWLIEICPASWLKRRRRYFPYKGQAPSRDAARRRILKEAIDTERLLKPDRAMQAAILADVNGDALDSLLAAIACFQSACGIQPPIPPPDQEIYRLEGYVYA